MHIVGGSGSGKTTLSRRVANRLGVTAYDLDLIAYEGGAGPERSLDARLADVQRILAQSGWVTEGIYLSWTEELLCRADAIVWLDVPFRMAAWRIVKRHIMADLRGNNRHPGWRRLFRFLRITRTYYYDQRDDDDEFSRERTARRLAPHAHKVIRLPRRRGRRRVG